MKQVSFINSGILNSQKSLITKTNFIGEKIIVYCENHITQIGYVR